MSKKSRGRGAGEATDADLVERFFGDPRAHGASRGDDRKLKQLTREIHRVLGQAVGELSDPRLASAFVIDVRPAPDASRFVVQVSAGAESTATAVADALGAARGHLRGELATALARRRTPELVFEVIP